MRANFKRYAAAAAVCAAAGALFAAPVLAQHEGHSMGNGADMPHHAAKETLAPLKILMPANGDIVGSRLAVVFETPTDVTKIAMSHHNMGTHLHIEAGDTALMPSQDQLIKLGGNKYLFLFDLPAQPGNTELRVSWAGADHKTITSSIQKVTVTVIPERAPSQ